MALADIEPNGMGQHHLSARALAATSIPNAK